MGDDAARHDINAGCDFAVWEGIYPSFAAAPAEGPGFQGAIAQERAVKAAHDVLTQIAAGGPLDYSLRQRNALLPVIAAMLLDGRASVRILDFGGGAGTGYMLLTAAVPDALARIEYDVLDLEPICEVGRALFAGRPGPQFHAQWPAGGGYDHVHTASTIQYVEDWRSVIGRLAGYGASQIAFSDAFVGPFPSYVTLQSYYGSRIRHWMFNQDEFIAEVERHGYVLSMRCPCDARILGAYGPLPMHNLPPERRIAHSSHLLFRLRTR